MVVRRKTKSVCEVQIQCHQDTSLREGPLPNGFIRGDVQILHAGRANIMTRGLEQIAPSNPQVLIQFQFHPCVSKGISTSC